MERAGEDEPEGAGAIVAVGVLGGAAFVALLLALFADDNLPRSELLLRTSIPSAILGFCLVRWPPRTSDYRARPLFRRLQGTHNAVTLGSALDHVGDQGPPPFTERRFERRRGGPLALFGFATVGTAAAWSLAGSRDQFGLSTDSTIVGALLFGFACSSAVRAAWRTVAASTAIRISPDRVVLGYAAGYVPPLAVARSDLRGVATAGDDVVLVSRSGRLDVIEAHRFHGGDEIAAALGATGPPSACDAGALLAVGANVDDGSDPEFVEPVAVAASEPDVQHPVPPRAPAGPVPTTADLEGAKLRLQKSAFIVAASGALVLAALVASVLWWTNQRAANDRLVEVGVPTIATVTDVDRSSRGPDSITVSFEYRGETYERSISSGWTRSFSRGLRDRNVVVLIDPDDPGGLIRSVESRNMNEITGISVVVSLFGLAVVISAARSHRRFRRLLADADWQRGEMQVRTGEGKNPTRTVTLVGIDGSRVTGTNPAGLRRNHALDTPCHFSGAGRWIVIVPEHTKRAVLLKVSRWRSALLRSQDDPQPPP